MQQRVKEQTMATFALAYSFAPYKTCLGSTYEFVAIKGEESLIHANFRLASSLTLVAFNYVCTYTAHPPTSWSLRQNQTWTCCTSLLAPHFPCRGMKYKGCMPTYYINTREWVQVWPTIPIWYSGVPSYHVSCGDLHQCRIKYLASQWIVQCCTTMWPPNNSIMTILLVSWKSSRSYFPSLVCNTMVMPLGNLLLVVAKSGC